MQCNAMQCNAMQCNVCMYMHIYIYICLQENCKSGGHHCHLVGQLFWSSAEMMSWQLSQKQDVTWTQMLVKQCRKRPIFWWFIALMYGKLGALLLIYQHYFFKVPLTLISSECRPAVASQEDPCLCLTLKDCEWQPGLGAGHELSNWTNVIHMGKTMP